MKRFVFCVLVVGSLIAPRAANALTCLSDCVFNYQFIFSADSLIVTLTGQLTTTNATSLSTFGVAGYTVLSANGTVSIPGLSYSSVTSLDALNDPKLSGFPYDNFFYYPPATIGPTYPGYFDAEGVEFVDANGHYYNLYNLDSNDSLLLDDASVNFVSENVSPVPEPSTWLMLLIGLTTLGLMAHRHKRRAVHSLV
jgi:hypothetical protein